MRLPITIEVILFKKEKKGYKFLLLKRVQSRGDFWQFLTGGLDNNDKSHFDCAYRELNEELQLNKKDVIKIIKDLPFFTFTSDYNGKLAIIHEYVFGFELPSNVSIKIGEEHEEYSWLSESQCLKLLKFENNKTALKNLVKRLKQK